MEIFSMFDSNYIVAIKEIDIKLCVCIRGISVIPEQKDVRGGFERR
jgi:hypothetical protein